MGRNKIGCIAKEIGTGIGVGLIAGLAGTIAITLSQEIEMKITGRAESTGPAKAVEGTLDLRPAPGTEKKLSWEVHWVYGTLWGAVRGLLGITGINKLAATSVHYAAITGTAMAMAPLEGAEPVNKWKPKDIAIDMAHHAVYALTVGCVFDALYNSKSR
jgi:hypothetical protein